MNQKKKNIRTLADLYLYCKKYYDFIVTNKQLIINNDTEFKFRLHTKFFIEIIDLHGVIYNKLKHEA